MHRVMTLDDIDKRYFARPLRNTLKKTVPDARPRQLLAILALGLDVSLAISAYVSDLAKNSEIGRKDWRLWYVWVALLNAIIRESQTNCEHFNKLVADLQQTLPELPAKHRGEGLNRDIKVALQWADQASSEDLSRLLKYWGRYDRVRRSKLDGVQLLLKRREMLSRSRKKTI